MSRATRKKIDPCVRLLQARPEWSTDGFHGRGTNCAKARGTLLGISDGQQQMAFVGAPAIANAEIHRLTLPEQFGVA